MATRDNARQGLLNEGGHDSKTMEYVYGKLDSDDSKNASQRFPPNIIMVIPLRRPYIP